MKPVKWQRVSKILIFCLLLAAAFFYRDSLAEIFQGIRQAEPAAVLMSAMLSMAAYFVEGMTIACMAGAVIPSGFCERDSPLRPQSQACAVQYPVRAEALDENAGQKEGQAGPLSIRQGIRITFLCEFYRMITLGNGSGFAEIHYLHKNGMEERRRYQGGLSGICAVYGSRLRGDSRCDPCIYSTGAF